MTLTRDNTFIGPVLALITALIATRYHHFGDALHLPDASLAVFFFAGYLRSKTILPVLLFTAALVDLTAVMQTGAGACLTPAYVFLLPAYIAMWLSGRYSARLFRQKFTPTTQVLYSFMLLVLAATIAFVFSNGGYYWFSGRFAPLSWAQYQSRATHYYWPSIAPTLLYGGLGMLALTVYRGIFATSARHSEMS